MQQTPGNLVVERAAKEIARQIALQQEHRALPVLVPRIVMAPSVLLVNLSPSYFHPCGPAPSVMWQRGLSRDDSQVPTNERHPRQKALVSMFHEVHHGAITCRMRGMVWPSSLIPVSGCSKMPSAAPSSINLAHFHQPFQPRRACGHHPPSWYHG